MTMTLWSISFHCFCFGFGFALCQIAVHFLIQEQVEDGVVAADHFISSDYGCMASKLYPSKPMPTSIAHSYQAPMALVAFARAPAS